MSPEPVPVHVISYQIYVVTCDHYESVIIVILYWNTCHRNTSPIYQPLTIIPSYSIHIRILAYYNVTTTRTDDIKLIEILLSISSPISQYFIWTLCILFLFFFRLFLPYWSFLMMKLNFTFYLLDPSISRPRPYVCIAYKLVSSRSSVFLIRFYRFFWKQSFVTVGAYYTYVSVGYIILSTTYIKYNIFCY